MVDDYVRAMHLPHMKYITDRTESGNVKVVIELPSDLTHLNATVVTPVNGYQYVEIPMHQRLFEGMMMEKQMPHSGWHTVMDNTHFTVGTLRKMTQGLSSKSMLLSVSVLNFFYVPLREYQLFPSYSN